MQYPQQAGAELDEPTVERMQQHAEYLNQQMPQLIQELEQMKQEQSGGAWGALLVWQFWALTGILIHFVVGNESFPMEISLPSGFRVAEAPNLFEQLGSSLDAHRKAVQEYNCLLHRLKQLLIHGH